MAVVPPGSGYSLQHANANNQADSSALQVLSHAITPLLRRAQRTCGPQIFERSRLKERSGCSTRSRAPN
eukprot:4605225-Prymnesium_polylepis.2